MRAALTATAAAGSEPAAPKSPLMRPKALDFGLVLALVVASIGVQMLVTGSDPTRFLIIAMQAATLVAAVRVSGVRRAGVRAASLAAVLAVAASIVTWIVRGDIPAAPAALVNGLLVGVAPLVIAAGLLRSMRESGAVTLATLAGVLAIYLLAGMFFSFLDGLIGAVDADAVFGVADEAGPAEELYFSFVTLTTVGYGDLAPVGDLSRTLAVAEMLVGQIYLVTVVALIVGNLRGRLT
jgi:hypothetical protein